MNTHLRRAQIRAEQLRQQEQARRDAEIEYEKGLYEGMIEAEKRVLIGFAIGVAALVLAGWILV